MRPIKAFAIVNKTGPELDLNEIYKAADIKEIKVEKWEKIIEVIIKEA